MNLTQLDVLKVKMGAAKDLSSIFEHFMDHFGDDEQFIAHGDRTEEPVLEACIREVARHLFGPSSAVQQMLMVAVPGTPFIHGSCVVNGRPSNLLYFSDTRVGLLAVLPSRRGEPTQYSRFTAQPIPKGAIDAKDRN